MVRRPLTATVLGGGVGVGVDGCDGCATTTIGVTATGVVTDDDDVKLMLGVIVEAGADVTAMETTVDVGGEAVVLD